jgi:hypothetical protein
MSWPWRCARGARPGGAPPSRDDAARAACIKRSPWAWPCCCSPTRPGLSIQIANRAGLLPRLRRVEDAVGALSSAAERVAFAVARFAAAPPAM